MEELSRTRDAISRGLRARQENLTALLPLAAMGLAVAILYQAFPSSFELTWKGRAYYLLFLWLVLMEILLEYGQQTRRSEDLSLVRTVLIITSLSLPAVYALAETRLGLNTMIASQTEAMGIYYSDKMPLSIEYLVMTASFALQILLTRGVRELSSHSVSLAFLGLIAMIYNIDNIYPYGRFTPFQLLVPTTTVLASKALNLMGYETILLGQDLENMPRLLAQKEGRSAVFSIAWPCSGVESLIIYSVTIMLFLKRIDMSRRAKVVYFLVGALVTYLINILRIATIFTIAIGQGMDEATLFHYSYGQMYSILWIVSYMLAIWGSRSLWRSAKQMRTRQQTVRAP
jgi:thaumarchaeosortase